MVIDLIERFLDRDSWSGGHWLPECDRTERSVSEVGDLAYFHFQTSYNACAVGNVASAAGSHKAYLTKDRERLVVPADPVIVAHLAKSYISKELGRLDVVSRDGATTFDFGEWKSTVASRKNDDGTISFITIDPTNSGFEFVIGERAGKRVLIIRDGQHEYTFTEVA